MKSIAVPGLFLCNSIEIVLTSWDFLDFGDFERKGDFSLGDFAIFLDTMRGESSCSINDCCVLDISSLSIEMNSLNFSGDCSVGAFGAVSRVEPLSSSDCLSFLNISNQLRLC